MTPVVLLSDAYLANGYETWKIPDASQLRPIEVKKPTDPETFKPYARNDNLARSWVYPGMRGFEHRIGGLEKENVTGNVCYTPENHAEMTRIRREKIKKLAKSLPDLEIEGDESADTLLVGWGSTYGTIKKVVQGFNSSSDKKSKPLANVHLRHLNPFNSNIEQIFKKFKNIIVIENNDGQAVIKLRHEFSQFDFKTINQVNGQPFSIDGLAKKIEGLI